MKNTLDELADKVSLSGLDIAISQLRYGGSYIVMLGSLDYSYALLGILGGGDLEAVGFESFLHFMDLPVYAFGETASEAIENLNSKYNANFFSIEIGEFNYGFIDLLGDIVRFEKTNGDDYKWNAIIDGRFEEYAIEPDLKQVIQYKIESQKTQNILC